MSWLRRHSRTTRFFNRPADADHAHALVDRLLTLTNDRQAEATTPSV